MLGMFCFAKPQLKVKTELLFMVNFLFLSQQNTRLKAQKAPLFGLKYQFLCQRLRICRWSDCM